MLIYDERARAFLPGALPPDGAKITALYGRLSQEDELAGDSGSITNQRDFLRKYAEEHRLPHPRYFSDDGYTGTNFDRPGWAELMELVEQGKVATIVVKDHSRLGRNRLKVGALMEQLTEDYGVRYVAITDNIDSDRGLDDMVAVRELFNEFYPRDTSKKIRAVFGNKGNNGERLCTQVPYGYVGDKHGWEIDPEAAPVVQEIFRLCLSGLGPLQIANRLSAEGHLNPSALALSRNKKIHNPAPIDPCRWATETVSSILERREYTGCTVNFKTHKKSYKNKKTIYHTPDQWKIFPGTHPAIIDDETFARVQELRKNKRRPTRTGKRSIFSGLLYCADCGSKMYYATCKRYDGSQEHFRCAKYKSNAGECSSHYIRETVLYDMVLAHLRLTLDYVRSHEQEFVTNLISRDMAEQKKALARHKRELAQAERRLAELDRLFQKLYEDNALGKLSDERYEKLSVSCEAEQDELSAKAKALRATIDNAEAQVVNVGQFLALVKKYTEIEELTPTILNEFIDHIDIHAPDKSTGHRVQFITIHYRFVDVIPERRASSETILTLTA